MTDIKKEDVERMFKKLNLDERDANIYYKGLMDEKIGDVCQENFRTLETLLEESPLKKKEHAKMLSESVLEITIHLVQSDTRNKLKESDWIVLHTADEDGASFSYTVGLSRHEGVESCELICHGQTNCEHAHSLLNEIAGRIKQGESADNIEHSDNLRVVGGFSLRVLLKEVGDKKHVLGNYTPAAKGDFYLDEEPATIYQVFLGDENNLLPREEGYNETTFPNLKHF